MMDKARILHSQLFNFACDTYGCREDETIEYPGDVPKTMNHPYPISAVLLILPFIGFAQGQSINNPRNFGGAETLVRLDEALKMVETFPDDVIHYAKAGLEQINKIPAPQKYKWNWLFSFHLFSAKAWCVKGDVGNGMRHLEAAEAITPHLLDAEQIKIPEALKDIAATKESLAGLRPCSKEDFAKEIIRYCKTGLSEINNWPVPMELKNKWFFALHLFLTKAYCVTGDFSEGQFHARSAVKFAQELSNTATLKAEDATLALKNVELFLSVADSIGLNLDERQNQELALQLRLLQQDNALREAELSATRRGLGFLGLLATLVIVVAGSGFWIFRTRQHAKELQFHASKDRELAMYREQLYVNITHELRTPLSLVISPLERLAGTNPHPDIQTALLHARELLHSFNDILKWNKLEANAMTPSPQVGEVMQEVQKAVARMQSMAESKGVSIELSVNGAVHWGVMDFEKIETILSNLLVNAVKFTGKGGSIKTGVALFGEGESQFLQIEVADNGRGIPGHLLPTIFERYSQAGQSNAHIGGSGIGLALVKRLTELLGGRIEVLSKPGKGTVFTVVLPFQKAAAPTGGLSKIGAAQPGLGPANGLGERPTVLLVEDNHELRAFIASGLSVFYELLEAETAEAGLEIARENLPDLVVTDLMLPGEMDGNLLCKMVKNDALTCHIPVLILTARSGLETRLGALDARADAFLTKPFAVKELELTLQSLLENRRMLRERFQTTLQLEWSEKSGDAAGTDPYLALVLKHINDHLDNSAFGVGQLAQAMKISRVQLFKKVKSLTGMPPGDLFRTIRLETAKKLLQTGSGNVSEVAYQTGFDDPNYFSTAFKRHFGLSPSEISREASNPAIS